MKEGKTITDQFGNVVNPGDKIAWGAPGYGGSQLRVGTYLGDTTPTGMVKTSRGPCRAEFIKVGKDIKTD